MARVNYKTYYRCPTESYSTVGEFGAEVDAQVVSYNYNGRLMPDGSYDLSVPWFFDFNAFPIGSCGWSFSPTGVAAGETYIFSFTTTNKDGSETEYLIKVVFVSYCAVEIDNSGCKDAKAVTWLTREGGWANYTFTGKRTFEVTIPEAKTYKNADYIIRNNSRSGVYTGELVAAYVKTQAELDLIESLKYSVQAYAVTQSDTGANVYTPILVQDGDFTKRKTGEKRWDVSVKFIYATELQIQSQ